MLSYRTLLILPTLVQATTPWEKPTAILATPEVIEQGDSIQIKLFFQGSKPASWNLQNKRNADELSLELLLGQTTLVDAEAELPSWIRAKAHRDIDGSSSVVLNVLLVEPVESRLVWQDDTLVWTLQDKVTHSHFWTSPVFWTGATLFVGAAVVFGTR